MINVKQDVLNVWMSFQALRSLMLANRGIAPGMAPFLLSARKSPTLNAVPPHSFIPFFWSRFWRFVELGSRESYIAAFAQDARLHGYNSKILSPATFTKP